MDTMVLTETTETDERKALFAGVAGEEELDRLQMISLDIQKMREMGVLVDIDIHGGSLFTTGTSWAELGIPSSDTRRKRLTRGSKDLIPALYLGRLRSLETRFRQSLEKHSFVLQGFRPFRWIPFTAYESWHKEWDELQAELDGLKAELLERYDEFVDQIAGDFGQIAREAWDAIRARRPLDAGPFALITEHGAFDSLDAFTDHVIQRAIAQMPSREQIEQDLYVDYKNALVATGADLEAERLRQDQIRTQRGQEQAEQRLAWNDAWAKEEWVRLDLREVEEMQDIRLRAERQKLAAMRQAELEHARAQLANTVSPLTEVVEQFRAQIYQDVQAIAASVQRNGHLRGKVAERAKGLLDTYRLLGAAVGDDELETALLDLRGRLDQVPAEKGAKKYDVASVEVALRQIADITHEQAIVVNERAGTRTRLGTLEI